MQSLTLIPDRLDVLFEQLGFLFLHREACEIPECPECVRFAKAQAALMTPFWKAAE